MDCSALSFFLGAKIIGGRFEDGLLVFGGSITFFACPLIRPAEKSANPLNPGIPLSSMTSFVCFIEALASLLRVADAFEARSFFIALLRPEDTLSTTFPGTIVAAKSIAKLLALLLPPLNTVLVSPFALISVVASTPIATPVTNLVATFALLLIPVAAFAPVLAPGAAIAENTNAAPTLV